MKKIYLLIIIIIAASSTWLYKNNYHKPVIKVKQINIFGDGKKLTYAIKDILDERYRVVLTDENFDIVADDVFGTEDISDYDDDIIKLFYTAESFHPDVDKYDLAMGFDHIDDPRYIRFPNYLIDWKNRIKVTEDIRSGQGECNPNKKHFACYLVSNGRDEMVFGGVPRTVSGPAARDSMFHKLSEYKYIPSGGKHLNNIGAPISRNRKKTQNWLEQCKFLISYENQYADGYVTEKVYQAYFAGAVPIYWGDKTAFNDINKDAVIYADDFKSEDDIVEYVKKVDQDDELYCKIWNQNLVVNPEVEDEHIKAKLRKKLFEVIDRKLKR